MKLSPTVFQPQVWPKLISIRDNQRVGSAYLFSGASGGGKEALALEFTTVLNCENPTNLPCEKCSSCIRLRSLQDERLKLVIPLPTKETGEALGDDPLKGLNKAEAQYLLEAISRKAADPFFKIVLTRARKILISSVRELRRILYLKSTTKGRKMVLMFQAHTLSMGDGSSANALLKILEEPPGNTTFILVTDNKAALLPTIISRCQQIDIPPMPDEAVHSILEADGLERGKAEIVTKLAHGDIHRARFLSERPLDSISSSVAETVNTLTGLDAGAWRSFTADYARLSRQAPEEFKFRLAMLQSWFHNAHLARSGSVPDTSISDNLNGLNQFNGSYPQADLQKIHLALDRVITAPQRNLNMPLVLTNLLLDVQDHLRSGI